MEESISTLEIRELALRYIDIDECATIPEREEAFALLVRPISAKKKNEWRLACYGVVSDYTTDVDEEPYGKWINIKYLSLISFPPMPASIRLQPPHIAKGYFQSFDRTSETKIVAIADLIESNESDTEAEILEFPRGKK
ncbi:MAG: hypothetical protein FWE23_01470 [Chitinivibrionia bacterium]|nr:hypothetical protein [Chitinivibrionia bacterium]